MFTKQSLHAISLAYGSSWRRTKFKLAGGGPETKRRSEDDLGMIRSATGDTGPRRREVFTAGEVKRGGYFEALVY